VIDLAHWINELTGNKSSINFKPKRDWDKSTRRRASIEKAGKTVDYSPRTNIRKGLDQVNHWFKSNWENIAASAKF
jgi:UDP-glucose 4-epimerase